MKLLIAAIIPKMLMLRYGSFSPFLLYNYSKMYNFFYFFSSVCTTCWVIFVYSSSILNGFWVSSLFCWRNAYHLLHKCVQILCLCFYLVVFFPLSIMIVWYHLVVGVLIHYVLVFIHDNGCITVITKTKTWSRFSYLRRWSAQKELMPLHYQAIG